MRISSSAPSLALSFTAVRTPVVKPGAGQIPSSIAQARADSADDRRRLEENAARHADAIAHFAGKGVKMTQGSYAMLYKHEVAKSIDADGDGDIGVAELAGQMGGGADQGRASRLHALLDIDGDGKLGLAEFGDSMHDPFRDAAFRRQLGQRGAMDPAALGALHRRHAAQYDAAAVLGAMAREVDTVA